MRRHAACSSLFLAALVAQDTAPQDGGPWQTLFDGVTLRGWDGDPAFWSVRDGCITGSSADRPLGANTFLVLQGEALADFEFECEVRLVGDNNSGIQYRARRVPGDGFAVHGYQCDVHAEPSFLGMLYEEGGRGILARHGERLVLGRDGSRRAAGALRQPTAVDLTRWRSLRIVARGRTLQHFVDGAMVVEVVDESPQFARAGVLALQLHGGAPMTVSFRGLRLRRLPAEPVAELPPPAGPQPHWIWGGTLAPDQELFLRRTFELGSKPRAAELVITCDNTCRVYVNGEQVASSRDWTAPLVVDVAQRLQRGENVLAVHGTNEGGPAGLCALLQWTDGEGQHHALVSDAAFRCAGDDRDGWHRPGFDARDWVPCRVLARLGEGPWASALGAGSFAELLVPPGPQPPAAAPELQLPPGHVAELLLRVPRSFGSWVCLAADPHGRLYASDQRRGLFRIHPAGLGSATATTIERVDVDLDGCQGLCWAFAALYAVVNGPRSGLYRLTDSDGDDRLDRVERLAAFDGSGEHGPHAVVPAPDGRNLLVLCGNHTRVPPLARSRLPRNWAEDVLQPKIEDPNGHAVGIQAPGGFVCLVDPDGKEFELYCAGFRNPYDLLVLPDGEVLTFDADMEWDMGLPWYRPTRILHVVSGADYGWRSGSAKWPAAWPDTLPSVCDIGPASPTGMVWTARGALALDWTFGTVYHLALQSHGSSFTASPTEWLLGEPLPVVDAVVAGGGLCLLTGGRGLPSRLYRIRGGSAAAIAPSGLQAGELQRRARRELEALHGGAAGDSAITAVWPQLGADDPFLRHAARIGLEWQPVASWRARALADAGPQHGNVRHRLTALLALARQGAAEDLEPLLRALAALLPEVTTGADRLALVRTAQLAVLRLGRPAAGSGAMLAAALLPWLPSGDAQLDRDLCALLARLDAGLLLERAVPLLVPLRPDPSPPWARIARRNQSYGAAIERMLQAMPPTAQLGIADALRGIAHGWTLEQRQSYFEFLAAARRQQGGASYDGYLKAIAAAAFATCSAAEQEALAPLVGATTAPLPPFRARPPRGPGREWRLAEASALARSGLRGRDYASGRNLFFAADCAACHRFAGEGGSSGPDLTSLGNKFTADDVLQAILEPSAVVSDQYAGAVVRKKDGTTVFGRVRAVQVDGGEAFEVVPAAAAAVPLRIPAGEVAAIEPSRLSPMPAGLVDRLAADELLDLLAFLLSRGDAQGPMHRR